ncbi:hypothetical protein DFH09DRAFT_1083851 [Mycena vulgaris]|nr:hypothetical protein DFH09DRAFT_1083851 [Mycena vulgaris]
MVASSEIVAGRMGGERGEGRGGMRRGDGSGMRAITNSGQISLHSSLAQSVSSPHTGDISGQTFLAAKARENFDGDDVNVLSKRLNSAFQFTVDGPVEPDTDGPVKLRERLEPVVDVCLYGGGHPRPAVGKAQICVIVEGWDGRALQIRTQFCAVNLWGDVFDREDRSKANCCAGLRGLTVPLLSSSLVIDCQSYFVRWLMVARSVFQTSRSEDQVFGRGVPIFWATLSMVTAYELFVVPPRLTPVSGYFVKHRIISHNLESHTVKLKIEGDRRRRRGARCWGTNHQRRPPPSPVKNPDFESQKYQPRAGP